jgi:hypothetical protein
VSSTEVNRLIVRTCNRFYPIGVSGRNRVRANRFHWMARESYGVLPCHALVRLWNISDLIRPRRRTQRQRMTDSVEKVGVSTQPNFFSAVGAIFRCGRGGPHHLPQTQRSEF